MSVKTKSANKSVAKKVPASVHRGKREAMGSFMGINGHQRTQDELRQNEKKYQTILERIQDGYCEVDLAGNFTFFNDSMCRIWGYPSDELIGMNYRQYSDKESAKRLFEMFNKVYRTGKPIERFDWQILRKDGTKRYIEASVSLQKDSSGKPIGFLGITRDVTERKQTEELLRQSEKKYRTILERIQDGYCEVDLAGNFTFFNDSMSRIWGYPNDELIGMNYRQYSDKESAKKLFEMFNEVYRTGKPLQEFAFQILRKDGTRRYIEASVSLQKDSSGKPIGFLGITRDVTERRQMEETIRQSEERYRTIIEEMEEWYFETDLTGRLLYFNDALVRVLGYSPKELALLDFRTFIKQEEGRIFKIFQQVYETGKSIRNQPHEVVRLDGKISIAEFSIFPKHDQDDKIIGFRGVGHDITERKRAEQELSHIATHDPLTGLPNRMLFIDRLKMGLAQAKRNRKKLAVLMLDLDRFKNVNDTLGHMVGDKLLIEIGHRLTRILRNSDTVARLGGDEFIILLPDTGEIKGAAEVAEKILNIFKEPFVCDGHKIISGTSIGIVIYPDDGEDADSLLKNSDTAMYIVKTKGLGNYHFFTEA
jgi:diguanylate cyclase (GGDEF)-like protein/PAS domain S-box-containing protein